MQPEDTLATLATKHPGASRVFQRHGLDFCCHGNISLADACEQHTLDPSALLTELAAEAATADAPLIAWDEKPLPELVDFILSHYHEPLRSELPRLSALARKVERVHREKATVPVGLADHLEKMLDSLERHMNKEEQVLFPAINAGRGRQAVMPVQVLEHEHEDHAEELARLRELANGFAPPEEACTTWRALYLGLEQFERELMEHIGLENNVLFPRALRS